MDIERPDLARKLRTRRIRFGVVGIILIALAALGLSQLRPALPEAERGNVWIDQVRRGTLLRQVRGNGALVPTDVNWISAATEARVERIALKAGTLVHADSVIMELTDPAQVQRALDAQYQLAAAEADYTSLSSRLRSEQLAEQAAAAKLKADSEQARLRSDADDNMARQGVLPELSRRLSKNAADELASRYGVELERLRVNEQSIRSQLAAQKAKVEAMSAQQDLQQKRLAALRVRAGIDGVLQQVGVEVGQRVSPGTVLAKVVEPAALQASVKIAETQAKDVQLSQPAVIDTHNGTVAGHVVRIDPAAQNGNVTVDIAPDGPLPKGARPDLSVEATIELERLHDVLYVGRPLHAEEETSASIFRIDPAQSVAERVKVKFGHSSINSIQVVQGLNEGDRIILSDTSQWDSHERIRLR